MASDIVFSF